MRTLMLGLFVWMFAAISANSQEPIDVCGLIRSAEQYDGKTVVVKGLIRADRHVTGIQGDGCSRVVIIRYDRHSLPEEFVNGVEDKRLKFDSRPFEVTVEGRFNSQIRGPLGNVSRIKVSKALKWEFIGEKATPAAPRKVPR